jgi:hypothetical protein
MSTKPAIQNGKLPTLKNDVYRRQRGGQAFFLILRCTRCSERIMLYQKDGDGRLKRCYLNRIFDPPELEALQREYADRPPGDLPPLACKRCNLTVGLPIRYRDGRLAYRLIEGTIAKTKL